MHLCTIVGVKDGVKDNFDLFQEAARQLEDKYFKEKLEQVRTASNAEGRQWLIGLMRDLDKMDESSRRRWMEVRVLVQQYGGVIQ